MKQQKRNVQVQLGKDGVVLNGTLMVVDENVVRFAERCPVDTFISPFVEYDDKTKVVSFIKLPKGITLLTLKNALGEALTDPESVKRRCYTLCSSITKMWEQIVADEAELKSLAPCSVEVVCTDGGTVEFKWAKPKTKKKAKKKSTKKSVAKKKADKDLFEEATKHAAKAHAEAVAGQA